MKVSVSKSKNQTIYYLSKSVWVNGKSTTKTIEKIGSEEDIKKICGALSPLDWAKLYAAKRSAEEKISKKDILIKYSSSSKIEKGVGRSVNIGYLFLKDIYYELGIDSICTEIAKKYQFEYDLNDILSMLVFSRVIYPGSKRSSLELSQKFLEKPGCELHQVYRALEILSKENDYFQSQLYKNSERVVDRQKEVLYYDCTNYYFEIETEDAFRKYGISKEHRPNPIVQMGLFIDADGMPLTCSIFNGNENEQPSMKPLEKKVLSDFGIKRFIVCTDAGLSSIPNRTNLEDEVSTIININQKRWQIEECFRIMKSEFYARPVYLSRKDRIAAHFITCFTSLILYRILEKKLGDAPGCDDIIKTLKEMNMLVMPGEGYIPEYTRTDLTDMLHDTFSFRTDYEIVSQRNMKKILTATRK